MKKSKKALLWTIVPVLGVSSGVAGAIAGVTSQKTSVDTNNVATSSTATTMATSRSTTSNLKIVSQSYDVASFSEGQNTIYVSVSGASFKTRYEWFVNRGDGWKTYAGGQGAPSIMVSSPKTDKVLDWTFRCKITDLVTNKSITSEDIKFTSLPNDGRYIKVTKQPESKKTVSGGDTVTLTTSASLVGTKYTGKTIGYQWFEYDSSNNQFTEIKGATSNSYTFTAPSNTKSSTTKKYVCRYYVKDSNQSITYLSESNQSIVTINKDVKEVIKVTSLTATPKEIKVGDQTTLFATATSTKTQNLGYQWYKLSTQSGEFEKIEDANTQSYSYKATSDDAGKKLTFMVMVSGIVQDGVQNYFQSNELVVEVKDSSQTTGSVTNETIASTLKVDSSVTTNQASVRSTFYAIGGTVKSPEYSVNVQGASELTYKWYYVSGNGKTKNLITDATSSTLKTNKSLYEKAYRDNNSHKVGIMCEIYNGTELVYTVDQSVNSRFYMTVVITRR